MLTNEQRAHDLAIVAAGIAAKSGDDIYVAYKDAYDAAIKAFNRDFPESRT